MLYGSRQEQRAANPRHDIESPVGAGWLSKPNRESNSRISARKASRLMRCHESVIALSRLVHPRLTRPSNNLWGSSDEGQFRFPCWRHYCNIGGTSGGRANTNRRPATDDRRPSEDAR